MDSSVDRASQGRLYLHVIDVHRKEDDGWERGLGPGMRMGLIGE